MSRIVRYTVLAFAGLIAGLPAGAALGRRTFDKGTSMFSDILALGESETLATLQYKESDLPHSRQALLDLLQFINEMEMNDTHGIQKEIELDRGIAYMRLALLEEKAGNTSEAKDYIRKAQESLKKHDGNEISEAKLRELTAQFDKTPTYKFPGVYLLSRGT